MTLTLYNTLTRKKEPFRPIDDKNVRMYVCGPTVYDDAHIGNARPIIVFDVLFRLLRHTYGAGHVTYVRNITDVDDKINARAAEERISIRELTERTTARFHADIAALGVLPPTHEPRATEHIDEMKALCEALVAKGHAYVAESHVLFHVPSMPDYGRLSNRSLDEMEAGARVEVAPYKRDPMDFVLWKPSKPNEPGWPSPCDIAPPGRPGWHIECSAMAGKRLGAVFDIHGGGIDLVFPHHENEIAQSRCAHGTEAMANVWMHNGFLQVEGEKMSKSLGNFVTINEILDTNRFSQRRWHGETVRLAMLMTHYRQPIDWTSSRLQEAERMIDGWYRSMPDGIMASTPLPEVVDALSDDLNVWEAISAIGRKFNEAKTGKNADIRDWIANKWPRIKASLQLLGLLQTDFKTWHSWLVRLVDLSEQEIEALTKTRLAARRAKNFKEADRIRDELAAMGIALKDAKDPKTGEIVTTWEVAR